MTAQRSPQLKRIQAARTTLLLDQPFFGVLALQLALREDPSCETAWTNGSAIGFSPAFVDTLSQDELIAVLAHEVLHCACGHPWRRDTRDVKRWNVATDYAINGLLTESGFKLPASGLINPAFSGKSSEWIYDRLPESGNDPNGNDPDDSNDPSGMGEVRDASTGEAADGGQTEADWQQLTKQAEKIAAAQGKLPGSMQRTIDQLNVSRVDWRSLLRRFVQEQVRADYSWTRPNTRYLCSGLFLPALHSIACGRIVLAIDTSGSIDTVLLAQFATEMQAIADEVQPSSVDVLYCDTHVHKIDTFERNEPLTIAVVGGGGTAFAPVFEAVAEGDAPAVLIYLTDLDGSFPDVAPDYPVIWAAYGHSSDVPFGELVRCND